MRILLWAVMCRPIRATTGAASATCSAQCQSPQRPNLNLQRARMTHVLGQLCPLVVALVWGSQMSTLHQRHLPVVTDTITYLNAQIRELNRLRGQVRKAELSARRARKPRRKRAKTPIEPGRPQDILGRPETAANDNQLAWPFIPFPEGWNGS
jgi:hypothetical protein